MTEFLRCITQDNKDIDTVIFQRVFNIIKYKKKRKKFGKLLFANFQKPVFGFIVNLKVLLFIFDLVLKRFSEKISCVAVLIILCVASMKLSQKHQTSA